MDRKQTEDQPVAPPKDWALAMLAALANKGWLALPIIVQTHGMLITGTTVAEHEYYRALAEQMSGGNSDEPSPFARILLKASESMEEDARTADAEKLTQQVAFIHFKDAQFFGGSGEPFNQPTLWRARLSEIAGFTIGALGD